MLERERDFCQFTEGEEERADREQEILAEMSYAAITGTIDHPYQNVSKQVNFWISNHDDVELHIHMAVRPAGCTQIVTRSSLMLSPKTCYHRERMQTRMLWVLNRVAGLYKILVRPESEFIDDFPNTLFGG